jgi:hypothetical protein
LHAPLGTLTLAQRCPHVLAPAQGKTIFAFGVATRAQAAAARRVLAKLGFLDVRTLDSDLTALAAAGIAVEFGTRVV